MRDPAISRNPLAREWLEIVRTGDKKRGEEVARNLLENASVTERQAIEDALRFFKF